MAPLWPTQPNPVLPKPTMPSSKYDSYNAKTTSVCYPWPVGVTDVERIALSAQGDLQRILSSFFNRPIVVELVFSNTTYKPSPSAQNFVDIPKGASADAIISSASPSTPIVQTRQVHLKCHDRIVCTATSTVLVTSPEVATLFLKEKYAIGQMFRQMQKVPAFNVLDAKIGEVPDKSYVHPVPQTGQKLWRKYTLEMPDFHCEILEVFPDRRMFSFSEKWLRGVFDSKSPSYSKNIPELRALQKGGDVNTAMRSGLKIVALVAFLLLSAYETTRLFGGRMFC